MPGLTETDAGALQARQPDTGTFRLWEAAGTAHFDHYGLAVGRTDTGDRQSVAAWFASMQHPTNQPSPNFTCDVPINSGPQTFVLRAAISHLDRWVARGTPPPRAPRLETISIQPLQYAVDANGIVRGGIRTPAVDAPVATLSGLGQGVGPSDPERGQGRFPAARGHLLPGGRRGRIRRPEVRAYARGRRCAGLVGPPLLGLLVRPDQVRGSEPIPPSRTSRPSEILVAKSPP